MPTGTPDLTPSNNTASDTDTVSTPTEINLAVTKTDGVVALSVGGVTIYTVRVTNNGSAIGPGANLVDSAGIGLTLTSVSCSTAVGNRCITSPLLADLTGAGVTLPALASGQFYEILLSAKVTATSGSVTNTAIITPPAGLTDTTPNNNSASDTDTLMLYKLWFPVIQNTPMDGVVSWNTMLGYEDLSLVTGQNDFDYNDWAVAISSDLNYTSSLLKSFSLSFTPRTRGGTYDHTFQISFPAGTFDSNGTVVINLYDQNHNLISSQVKTLSSSAANIYVIFPKTSEVFPGSIINTVEGKPTVSAQRYAELTVTFDTPVPFSFDSNDLTHPHGQNLFFDPTLLVINNGEEIHRGDVRLLNIPTTTYLWPEEGVRIDRAYPLVTYIAGTPPSFSFPNSWWTESNHCVYDGVPCGTP